MAEKLDVCIGDFSVAFMHANISDENVFCRPPEPWRSRYHGWVWKMNKAMNGVRKAQQNFQDFISTVLTDHLGFDR
eukprot:2627167-Pyramimonas_sp.AAC.1